VESCYKIKIGTCIFAINAPEDLCIELHPNIAPFRVKDESTPAHINVSIYSGFPEIKEEPKQLTNARNLPEFHDHEFTYHYYTLNKTSDQFIIISGMEENQNIWDRVAVSDFKFQNWSIYISEKDINKQFNPLSFPIGPLVFYYGITLNNGILLHAAGLKYRSKGFIFTGISGIGKTTMSNLWLEKGGELINDDRLILMRNDMGYSMFNSPMAYRQEVKSYSINALFLLKQSRENKAIRLSDGAALARVMALCIQHNHDKILVDSLVKNVHNLIEQVPVYELEFKPDESIVNYIEKNYM